MADNEIETYLEGALKKMMCPNHKIQMNAVGVVIFSDEGKPMTLPVFVCRECIKHILEDK